MAAQRIYAYVVNEAGTVIVSSEGSTLDARDKTRLNLWSRRVAEEFSPAPVVFVWCDAGKWSASKVSQGKHSAPNKGDLELAAACLARERRLSAGDRVVFGREVPSGRRLLPDMSVVVRSDRPNGTQEEVLTCLARRGIWRLEWRLPIVTACTEHNVFLVACCGGCGQRFRLRRYSPLRPILGTEQPCGNQIGLRSHCEHPALAHRPVAASAPVLQSCATIKHAIAGQSIFMLGERVDPRIYLTELRHLVTLLLHLAGRSRAPSFVDWAGELQREACERRTDRRGPRWGISPPRSAEVRGNALCRALQILNEPSVERAGTSLAAWFGLIADSSNGPSSWLVNRTSRSTTMEKLIIAALSNRHRIGRRIDHSRMPSSLPPAAIPQLVDQPRHLPRAV